MPLHSGSSLGPYEIISALGAGGMGEVYRARDSRLKRDVAIKVLPSSFAGDPERITRLQREAEILASLNHPHIAHIYGLEETSGTMALVMELVEGPTLADRLVHGPISIGEALPIAKQIAEALEAAHEQGIVHRDLKPANVKVRSDGTVKVLDFGLAKALEQTSTLSSGASLSPTITTPAMTQAGVILGTAAYMSPEQARGGPVEKRADIWAFGVVLYEMLTGRRLFDEPTVSDTLAAVLKTDVTFDALPPATPPSVKHLIARCLTRDWRRRLRDIGEARIAIEDAISHPHVTSTSASLPAAVVRPLWWRALPWAIAILALAMAAVATWAPWRTAAAPEGVTRLNTDVGADVRFPSQNSTHLCLSPDGQLVAFAGSPRAGDRPRLYVRALNQLQATPLPGTDGARNPFFSPDSRWIGFFADGKLKKIQVRGGAAVALADAPDDRGGSWADAGWIAFTPRSGESPVFRVSSDGGTPEPLTKLQTSEVTHRWPQILPGSRAVLYTAHAATGNYEQADIVVQSLEDGRRVVAHHGGYYATYLFTGYLFYISQGTLFAAPFDLERFEMTTQPIPVLSDVSSAPGTGAAQFSFSQTGTFLYEPAGGSDGTASINWIGRDGKSEPLRAQPSRYTGISFSPDGERLAMAITTQQSDIWVYDWRRDILARLTSHESLDADPVWTPDGRRVTFRSARDGVDNLFWQRADESGEPQRLTESKIPQWPMTWHPNGQLLAYREIGRDTGLDIWILPIEGDEASGWKPGKPSVFLASPANETEASFSPDGRWLAYQSNESGRNEVYVRAFPGPGSRWQVSAAGGSTPRWSRGKELVYLSDDAKLMVATYKAAGDSFQAEKPRLWSDGPFGGFDLHPGGQRAAVLTAPPSESPTRAGRLVFIFNFDEEIRRLAP